ncbi:unnamed protein product [Umbelopsis ramanniana]
MGNNASRDQKVEGKGERRKRKALSTAVNKVANNFGTSSTTVAAVLGGPTPIGHRVVLHDQATPLSTLTGLSIPRPSAVSSKYNHSRGSSLASDDMSPLSTPSNNSPGSLPRTFGTETGSHGSLVIGDEMGYLILEGKRPVDRRIPRSEKLTNGSKLMDAPAITSTIYDYQGSKEVDRQLRQHYLFKRIFNGNYAVPLNNPTCILDSGCGTGLWAHEMSQEFPNASVVGLDLTPPAKHHRLQDRGLIYVQGDVHNQLELMSNAFDFVYQRDMATVIPLGRWMQLIQEFYRVLKPGGWLQLVEYDLPFKCPGPVLSLINDWFEIASNKLDISPRYAANIKDYLRDACFQDIHEQVYDIPIGEWPNDPMQKEFGFLYREQQKILFKSMKKWWLEEIHVSSEDYDRVCQEALNEFDEYHSFSRWRVFTARKPL